VSRALKSKKNSSLEPMKKKMATPSAKKCVNECKKKMKTSSANKPQQQEQVEEQENSGCALMPACVADEA